MGYTHYWTQTRDHTWNEWEEIRGVARAIVDQAMGIGIPVRVETLPPDAQGMIVEGVGTDVCEALHLNRLVDTGSLNPGWDFCKTRGYAYDAVITAVLAYLAAYHDYDVSSDGDALDWAKGVTLASIALKKPIPNPLFVKELTHNG